MATGDLEGNLERLRVQLRTIGYPRPLDLNGLKEGNPAAILPLLHYALLGYSRHVSRYLSENGYALFAKSDLHFVECTLKYLRGEFAYRCPLTVAQIFSRGFAERKFLFVYDVIQVCKRKHSELVKQARQARKTFKRDTTLSDFAKNIDAANMDALHMDENLSLALEKVSQAQERINGRFTADKFASRGSKTDGPVMENQARDTDQAAASNLQQSSNGSTELYQQIKIGSNGTNSKPHKVIEVIRLCNLDNPSSQANKAAQPGSSELCEDPPYSNVNAEMPESADSAHDVDASLSHCYEQLREQIVEVAEKLEKLLLNLKGDVQRMTSSMQVKLTTLERQTQYLEQALPSQQQRLVGRRTPPSYENLRLYERSYPIRRLEESAALQIPLAHTIKDISNIHQNHVGFVNLEIPQTQSSNLLRRLHHQQQLSTQELIASVKARCNKTKELLMDNGWTGPHETT